jgi:hypothetical protein
MAFVRPKRAWGPNGYTVYYYLVESRREGGRVRQVVLAYLGHEQTVEAAWWQAEEEIRRASNRLSWLRGENHLSACLERERLGRKLGRLLARIEDYKRYASGPQMPDHERACRPKGG